MITSPSHTNAHELGNLGEEYAAEALANAGYRILQRNWQADSGEVDIIAYHRHTLVAIEVKTRRGSGYGGPLESITAYQLRRIQRGLLDYKQTVYPQYAHTPIRTDIVGVAVDQHGDFAAELLQDVI
ncbi:MAG TPA: YraN family protein [Candidatus Yaniella excrementigallinarum]|nr:YraN family protein [Candidatus Yaniella excrementigallinarum]